MATVQTSLKAKKDKGETEVLETISESAVPIIGNFVPRGGTLLCADILIDKVIPRNWEGKRKNKKQ